ncbi:MAG: sodium-dependent transporter [Bacteroidales bacterium]|nr:sodium-dependent transporter [Bacteroidales bacterium]
MSLSGNDGRDGFTSKFGILCATAGSAIGLGNIWRFPYVVGENGGGAFLLVYLGFILLLGIPVMLSELVIGRRGQRNTFGAFRKLAPGKPWWIIGVMGIAAAFMILAFYSTIAGWTLEYIVKSFANAFQGQSSESLAEMFREFHTGIFWPLFWQVIFMIMTAWIILAGVKKGIEKYAKILMPFLVGLLLIMAIRSITLPGAMGGLQFLFKPDFSELTAGVFLAALGQAFFSLSIGMGAIITYGSYISKGNNLTTIAAEVSIADTLIAILAGVAIFPAVFAFNLDPAEGPGLIFHVLPSIFQQMPGGYFFAVIFFVLLAIAAVTSSISILEVVVAFVVEELKISRRKATIMSATAALFVGVFCTLSFSSLGNVNIGGLTIFGVLDFTASNILLPLGGLLIVIFVGWVMMAADVKDELSNAGALKIRLYSAFNFIIKFIAPVAIAIIFLNSIGILKI